MSGSKRKTTNDEDNKISKNKSVKLSESKVKDLSWKTYCPNHEDIGNCFCCNKTIRRSETEVDFGHVQASSKGGEYTIENIRPLCRKCNLSMGNTHMFEYMTKNQTYG